MLDFAQERTDTARVPLVGTARARIEFEIMTGMLALLRSSIGAFLGWWFGELAGLMPRRLRQQGRRERRGPVLIFGRQQSVVLQRTGEDERVLGSVDTDAPDHDQRLSRLLKQVKRRRRPLTVRLSDELGLRKILDLPLAAKDDLDQMLRLEMDRLTPFRADEVYFAHRVLGSDARTRRLSVELQLAPKRELERALETARSFGIIPPRVELAAGAEGGSALNLLPGEPVHGTRENRLRRALAIVALLLAVTAVAIPLQRQRAPWRSSRPMWPLPGPRPKKASRCGIASSSSPGARSSWRPTRAGSQWSSACWTN